MAAKKKAAKKSVKRKSAVKANQRTIVINVMNEAFVKTQITNTKTILAAIKAEQKKIYPPIYTYIYEREPQDMARIYEEHRNIQNTPKKTQQIAGFKLDGNNLVAISKTKNSKK